MGKIKSYWFSGIAVLSIIICLYSNAMSAIFTATHDLEFSSILELCKNILADNYILQVVSFSFTQAFLSTVISIFLGILLARALFYQSFGKWEKFKKVLLHFYSLTFVLPALVVILGLLGIYGNSGLITQSLKILHIDIQLNIYGLSGILLAHVFFNLPLATQLFLQTYQSIPNQHFKLAIQLNLQGFYFIRWVEWHFIKGQILPTFLLVFTLCFTSFAIVLTLGGSPKYTSLEVAIYQALIFDFDLKHAVIFCLLQMIFCFVLFILGQIFSKPSEKNLNQQVLWLPQQKNTVQIWQFLLIIISSLFLLLPLGYLIYEGFLQLLSFQFWLNIDLWQAISFSLLLAPTASVLALILALSILLTTRRLIWQDWCFFGETLKNIGLLILAIPTIILATGLFLLFQTVDLGRFSLFLIVVVCNSLSVLPFILKILAEPMLNNLYYYEKLCQSLGITGIERLRWIEWHYLKSPILYAFALSCCLSLGDFTAIALFGSQDFSSLPYLLYRQLGHYQSQEAAGTALILFLCCLGFFTIIQGVKKND